jgi:hypothetical protein
MKELVYDQKEILGLEWHIGNPTEQAQRKFNHNLKPHDWTYWLNTPYSYLSHEIRVVIQEGSVNYMEPLGNEYANTGENGVRPALVLDSKNVAFRAAPDGNGTESNPYVVQAE